jgi:hypothetical protein
LASLRAARKKRGLRALLLLLVIMLMILSGSSDRIRIMIMIRSRKGKERLGDFHGGRSAILV